jgi:hypothetical protein
MTNPATASNVTASSLEKKNNTTAALTTKTEHDRKLQKQP